MCVRGGNGPKGQRDKGDFTSETQRGLLPMKNELGLGWTGLDMGGLKDFEEGEGGGGQMSKGAKDQRASIWLQRGGLLFGESVEVAATGWAGQGQREYRRGTKETPIVGWLRWDGWLSWIGWMSWFLGESVTFAWPAARQIVGVRMGRVCLTFLRPPFIT